MITEYKTELHSEEWKALRNRYIGGSDAGAVIGLNPYKSAFALWAEKTGHAEPFAGNLATDVGTYLEEFVAKLFEKETGKRCRRNNRSMVNDLYPWAIANIDREIIGENAGLEIKTTSVMNIGKFKNGEFPTQYYAQCVHYMAVTGKTKWYLAVLIGNSDFKMFTIERDQSEIDALMDAEKDFYRLIQEDAPPAVDGMASTSKALNYLYPDSGAEAISLYESNDAVAEYMAITAQIKVLEAKQDECANRIKAEMKDAAEAFSGAYKATWKTSSRNTFDYKRFMAAHPEFDYSDYMKTTATRTFKVAVIKKG